METVLPALLSSLGAPSALIGFVPQLVIIGFSLPPLFTAHYIAGLHRVKPFIVRIGAWQRLPYLVGGLTLLFGEHLPRELVIAIVFLTPLISALLGGISLGACNIFFAKCIPPARRPSAAAARGTVGSLLCLTSGVIVTAVLARFPSPAAYGILHLIAFGALSLSLLSLSSTREPDDDAPPAPRRGFRESLPLYRDVLVHDRRFRAYLFTRIAFTGFGLLTPFLSIHALGVLHAEPALLGRITLAVVLGRIAGNVLSALIGDHHGGLALSRIAQALLLIVCCAFPFASGEGVFLALFAAWGLGTAMDQNASQALVMDIAPLPRLAAYVSILSIGVLPFVLVAGALAGAIYNLGEDLLPGTLALNATLAGACLVVALIYSRRLHASV